MDNRQDEALPQDLQSQVLRSDSQTDNGEDEKPQWQKSRRIVRRISVEGTLVLETPTHLGNGIEDGFVDMALMRDEVDGGALLTGTSIAGALRSYLLSREVGYRKYGASDSLANLLFGKQEGDRGEQSLIITHDARSKRPDVELRDGVAIDAKTRTAEDNQKFDIELLAAGTAFVLRFELLVLDGKEAKLRNALAMALQGFERGEISLGVRKRRGFGRCRVSEWRVRDCDLMTGSGLLSWLQNDGLSERGGEIAPLLHAEDTKNDQRSFFEICATFGIDGSLLIRSYDDKATAPDMTHLHSKRNGKPEAVVSGTSLGGALRARAAKIARTLCAADEAGEAYAYSMIDDLFGPRTIRKDTMPWASRVWVEERVVEKPLEMVVHRVKIDRFTGGSYPTALFNQQPVFGIKDTEVTLKLRVDNASDADCGLLLLLLKDLWTGDLLIGGEASVGRGRLVGKSACIKRRQRSDGSEGKGEETGHEVFEWTIAQQGDSLALSENHDLLQGYVTAWTRKVQCNDKEI